jgi:anti-sigma regulatory factor (Ser/Thr protein kinase)
LGDKRSAEIDNDVTEIARVTALVETFSKCHNIPEAVMFHVTLALDELLTNIISYGFSDGSRHKITASISIDGDVLEAETVDDGIAFDPLARPSPKLDLSVEEREIGGLGIHFIRRVMDHVDYRRIDGRNHLRMLKKLPPDPRKQV